MLTPQFVLPIHHEVVVDLFAGGGGASTGIEQAIGRPIDVAINHDREAVALHQANHPQTTHYVEDVFAVDPVKATGGRPVGLLWASPDCTFHSKARGGKPHRDRNKARRRRALAWVVVKWAKLVRPRVIALENVEEFQAWGPLQDDGQPCPQRRGESFKRWVAALRNLGYEVDWRELRACDYGTPTIRKRLYLVARCDGVPIAWPQPTHGAPTSLPVRQRKLKAWRAAAECIDWSLACPSIFERTRPLAEATLRRIAKGMKRYVIEAKEPFIVPASQLLAPFITEHANASNQRNFSSDEPLRTQVAQVKGGHFALVTAFLAQYNNHSGVEPHAGRDARDPSSTVTTTGCHQALVAGSLLKLRGTSRHGQAATEPLHTISAGGTHFAEVRAFLIKYYGNEVDGVPLDEPMHTIPTKDRFGLVMVRGEPYAIVDIGMRMLTPRELYAAQGFPLTYSIEHGADPFTGARIALTKTAQVRMCGNSVCPPVAAALVRANYVERQPERLAA